MKQWFKMSADAKSGVGEIMIYDMIGRDWWSGEGVTAKDFDRDLKALGDVSQINLRVNSPGGDVFDGVAIYNALKSHPATITAYIDGIAASAASLIVMAADEIVMPANSFMLIHEPSGGAWGTSATMLSVAADLERMTATFAATYAERSGSDVDAVRTLMAEDRLMDAAEAVNLGFADRSSDPVRMVASYDLKALPEAARERIRAAMTADGDETGDAPVEESVASTEEEAKPDLAQTAEAIAEAGNVVALSAARDDGVAYAREVAEMCLLAGVPHEAPAMIASRKPVAEVRASLLSARASASAETELSTKRPLASVAASGWGKVLQKFNSTAK